MQILPGATWPTQKKVLYLPKNRSTLNKKLFYSPMKTEIFEKNFYIHLKQKSQKMLLRVTLKNFLHSLKTELLEKISNIYQDQKIFLKNSFIHLRSRNL